MPDPASGPLIKPPDCETAQQLLERRFAFHRMNSQAIWKPIEYRTREADKATDAMDAFGEVEDVQAKLKG
jgi:hypothetical protein